MHFTAFLLPLLASANAAITILYPTSNTIWYRNDTVAINWTLSDPASDTYLFRAFLSNADTSLLPAEQQIADSTNASATYVRVALPRVGAGQGYKVSFVNTTNETQVYAQSESFEIQDGQVTTSSSSIAPSATTSGGGIPNAGPSQAGFPSASAAQSSGAASPGQIVPALTVTAQGLVMAGLVGGAFAILL